MKVYVCSYWIGGGGEFWEYGPVFEDEEQAKKWEEENEGKNNGAHTFYDELDVIQKK